MGAFRLCSAAPGAAPRRCGRILRDFSPFRAFPIGRGDCAGRYEGCVLAFRSFRVVLPAFAVSRASRRRRRGRRRCYLGRGFAAVGGVIGIGLSWGYLRRRFAVFGHFAGIGRFSGVSGRHGGDMRAFRGVVLMRRGMWIARGGVVGGFWHYPQLRIIEVHACISGLSVYRACMRIDMDISAYMEMYQQ